MTADSKDPKSFGNRPRDPLFDFRRAAKVFLVCLMLPIVFFVTRMLAEKVFEGDNPILEVKNPPKLLDKDPISIRIAVQDEGAGIDQLTAELKYKNRSEPLLERKYNSPERVNEEIVIDPQKLKLPEGAIEIVIRVNDSSQWKNKAEQVIPILVDRILPELQIIDASTVGNAGDTGIVIYRASDANLIKSGVIIGDQVVDGAPIGWLDSATENPTLLAALVPLVDPAVNTLTVYAEDAIGHRSTSASAIKVKPLPGAKRDLQIDDLCTRQAQEMFLANTPMLQKSVPDRMQALGEGDPQIRDKLDLLFNEVQRSDRKRLQDVLNSGLGTTLLWNDAFKALPATPDAQYGDVQSYLSGKATLFQELSDGIVMHAPRELPVVNALGDGRVIFSGNLGTYGNIVAVDHGVGVTSVYTSLDTTLAFTGSELKRGQHVGTPGRSGLCMQFGYGFQIWISGVPVNPARWLDKHWLNEEIYTRLLNAGRH